MSKRTAKIVCGLLATFYPLSVTSAQQRPIPAYDISGACEAKNRDTRELIGRVKGPLPEPDAATRAMLQSGCERQEQTALAQLTTQWSVLPQAIIVDKCFRHTLPSGMLTCIDGWRRDEEGKTARLVTLSKLQGAGETIPRYDVENTCHVAAARERDSQSVYRDCVTKQQDAYDTLKPIWPKLSKEVTEQCVRIMVGHPRYSVLQSCVEYSLDEIAKKATMPKGQFRY